MGFVSRLGACVFIAGVLAAGCGESSSTGGAGVDPTPQRLDGSQSQEFEPDDLEAAVDAGRLVELYCDGIPSEAQRLGCLSHVTPDQVCAQDTAAREAAVSAYLEETGDDLLCG